MSSFTNWGWFGNFVFSDLPEHEFKFYKKIYQRGAKAGQTHVTITLTIPPYEFTKGTVRNNFVYFQCNGCRSLKVNLLAKAQLLSNGDYKLLECPHFTNHVCTAYNIDNVNK